MIDKKKKYKLGDFNYRLPKNLVAQHPESRRDYSKLMVVHQKLCFFLKPKLHDHFLFHENI